MSDMGVWFIAIFYGALIALSAAAGSSLLLFWVMRAFG